MADLSYFHGVNIVEDGVAEVFYAPPSGGGEVDPQPPDDFLTSLDFTDPRNSQYVGQVI